MRTLFLLRRLLQHAGSELAVAQTADPAAALCSQNLRFSADSLPCIILLCSLFTRNVSCLYCKFIFLLNRLQIFRYLLHSFCQKKIVFKKQLFPLSLNYGRIDCPFPCLRAERSGHSITEFVVALYKKTTDRFTFPINQMIKENRAELHGYCRISADFASIAYGENQLSERQRVLIFAIQ